MNTQRATVISGGKLVLPARFRRALGIEAGDELIVELAEDEMRIRTVRASLARARAIIRRRTPPGSAVVDELLAERRAEAAGE